MIKTKFNILFNIKINKQNYLILIHLTLLLSNITIPAVMQGAGTIGPCTHINSTHRSNGGNECCLESLKIVVVFYHRFPKCFPHQ